MRAAARHLDHAPYDGHTVTDPMPHSPHCATLVVDEAITKLDALAAISGAVQNPVRRPGTNMPFVDIGGGAWAQIEIPKFGEAPPLAIDVYSARSVADAQTQALDLMGRLVTSTAWRVSPMFRR